MADILHERISTGVPALDEILDGGLIPGNAYLVRGTPGTGKTLLGMHFLAQGAQAGEATLFIALSEPAERVQANAQAVNVDISNVRFLDMTPGPELFADDRSYDIFTAAEVERGPITEQIVAMVREVKPQRVFLDAITQLRYLSSDEQEFRRQTFSLLRYLTEAGATVLYSSEFASAEADIDLQFMSDGVIELGREGDRRTVQVLKLRSSDYQAGFHGMRIDDDGVHVFPRIVPSVSGAPIAAHKLATGIAELDEMLRGGLEAGSITMISGPLGIGKTTLGLQILRQAAQQGRRGAIYLFEEAPASVMQRAEAMGMSLEALTADGRLTLEPIEPLRMTAQEFAYRVRQEVEMSDVRMVMLDSVSGYRLSLRGEDLVAHLHALSRYLRSQGVTVLLINETELGREPLQSADPSIGYLADNILFLRYLEADGMLQAGIGVLKRRLSDFDRALRCFALRDGGIAVGAQIKNVRGDLYGVPKFESWAIMARSEGAEILVVSKHRENARQLQRVLGEAGYGVQMVHTVRDFAAHVAAGELHDLALVDISGFDERIWEPCRSLHDAGVPFLIVGARAGPALEKAGTTHGAQSVLVKPLAVQELLTLIRIMLER